MKRNLTTAEKTTQREAWIIDIWRRDAKPLLGKLIKWTAWTVFVLNLAVVTLYVIGSNKMSSDEAQLALVRICLILSLLLIISSAYGLILDIFYVFKKRKASYLIGVAGYIFLMILGVLLALIAAFIIGAVKGNLDG